VDWVAVVHVPLEKRNATAQLLGCRLGGRYIADRKRMPDTCFHLNDHPD
jgi:hypothetical protein